MKIKEEFPNYLPALMFYIGDKNPAKSSDDSKVLSFFLGLKNFKKGFDYYELTRHNSGGVYFSVVTMLGFKTVLRTDSQIFHQDLIEIEWQRLIGDYSNKHLMSEEYQALKRGYVQKGSGCMGSILLVLMIAIGIISYLPVIKG